MEMWIHSRLLSKSVQHHLINLLAEAEGKPRKQVSKTGVDGWVH
jgi:hypothetical protein